MNELYARDLELVKQGRMPAGVDEAGRGALAGPVVCAAVILDYNLVIDELNDSKQLTPKRREKLFDIITDSAVAYQIVSIDASYIDTYNILAATLEGMRQAMVQISPLPSPFLIDGNQLPFKEFGNSQPLIPTLVQQTVVDGDALHACIAAASILAKVHRDRMMMRFHDRFPHYGFDRHKGYGTAAHLKALRQHGPCELHRQSFAPVREIMQVMDIFRS